MCALTVLLAAAPSCDIKEDRGPCPCLLTLIYKEVPEVVRDVFRARIYRGESLQKDEEVNPSAEPEGHSVYVSKGENTVCLPRFGNRNVQWGQGLRPVGLQEGLLPADT